MPIAVIQEMLIIKSLSLGITSFLQKQLSSVIVSNNKLCQSQRQKPNMWL